jgi:hypothetical protein
MDEVASVVLPEAQQPCAEARCAQRSARFIGTLRKPRPKNLLTPRSKFGLSTSENMSIFH